MICRHAFPIPGCSTKPVSFGGHDSREATEGTAFQQTQAAATSGYKAEA